MGKMGPGGGDLEFEAWFLFLGGILGARKILLTFDPEECSCKEI